MRALLVALAFTTATPLSHVVRLDSGSAPVFAGARVGTLEQAIGAFGKPDHVLPLNGAHPVCRATWKRYGLEIQFSSTSACSRPGSWWRVTMRAELWQTKLGLHVGDSDARLRTLYPDARRLDSLGSGAPLELESGGPLCDGGPPFALAGRIADGKVVALLVVRVPSCG